MMNLKVFLIVGYFHLTQSETLFMPNLPLGQYRTVFEKIYSCDSNNYTLQFNCFLSKKTLNSTELKGNITFFSSFDDTMSLDLNVASWSQIGGWKPNSIVYKAYNACNSLKNIGGNLWHSLIKSYSIPTSSCPLPAGTYITSGLDSKKLEEHNFPKVYFYGKYKMMFKIRSQENKLIGCGVFEVSLIRPWETPI